MAAPRLAVMPLPSMPWVDDKGRPTFAFLQFMQAMATHNVGPFVSADSDADAAKAGVSINSLYEKNGVLQVRKS